MRRRWQLRGQRFCRQVRARVAPVLDSPGLPIHFANIEDSGGQVTMVSERCLHSQFLDFVEDTERDYYPFSVAGAVLRRVGAGAFYEAFARCYPDIHGTDYADFLAPVPEDIAD